MTGGHGLRDEIRNLLQYGDLSFRDFVELALYHPQFGYYAQSESPVGRDADYVTSPLLSPVFSYALGRLIDEFVRAAEVGPSTVVDIGCGDGALIHSLYAAVDEETRSRIRWFGVDRNLERVHNAAAAIAFVNNFEQLPRDGTHLLLSNELFDALPFSRLVQRGEHLHELWVTEGEEGLDWREHEAAPLFEDYFVSHGIELEDGQFADVSLEWGGLYGDLARVLERGLIVTFDYGFAAKQLFHPRIRRFGTAASYSRQRVTRDLLDDPGGRDLTAHINFADLERAGEQHGLRTLCFERQAKFLLSLGITDHELFRPVTDLEIASAEEGLALMNARDEARRLVLPDGIGEDIRVLVQGKGMKSEGWSFQKKLW